MNLQKFWNKQCQYVKKNDTFEFDQFFPLIWSQYPTHHLTEQAIKDRENSETEISIPITISSNNNYIVDYFEREIFFKFLFFTKKTIYDNPDL